MYKRQGIHCSIKGSINFTTGSITEGYVFAPYDLAKDESEFVFDTRKTTIASRFKQAGSVWDEMCIRDRYKKIKIIFITINEQI